MEKNILVLDDIEQIDVILVFVCFIEVKTNYTK